jgi:RimJ/RimL family protein N-acetyltransferase
MLPEVRLVRVIRGDVERMGRWLQDPEVNASWYGTDVRGEAVHIGYAPRRMVEATPDEWDAIFLGPTRRIFSVLTGEGEHIGEAQMVIHSPLREAQLFVLIGRKDMWYWGFGTAALFQLLELAFDRYLLHRAWVDVPAYNLPAIHMCERVGFVLEGRLRHTHPKDGNWYDSLAMGLLAHEYQRRREALLGTQEFMAA